METTKLSSKGQIVLPKAIRQSRRWPPGTEFLVENTPRGILLRPPGTEFFVENTPRGILLRPRKPFGSTEPAEVFGRLKAGGGARTVTQMDEGLRQAFRSRRR